MIDRRSFGQTLHLLVPVLLIVLMPHLALGQGVDAARPGNPVPGVLDEFSRAIEVMIQGVAPSVVQVTATRFDVGEPSPRTNVATGLERSVGSGVVVASDGYIMTNAHVVAGAHQLKVRLVPSGPQTVGGVLAQSFMTELDATLVGTYAEADLALVKIAAENLPALPIASLSSVRQGQMTFAFGSPGGLQNSVTMGVVSSIARQLEPDDPMLYIQTDTPINPGNSGGPLVSTAGEMIGLNTFISSQSGGSEGIGFAIPGAMVKWVYAQLREHGHVHRPIIGAGLQTITPIMAEALKLHRQYGVIVSDLRPGTPAAQAGLKLNDILISVNDSQMDNVAAWIGLSFQHAPGSTMSLKVLRNGQMLSVDVLPGEMEVPSDRLADIADLSESQIAPLGIMAVTLDKRTEAAMGPVRLLSGAIVIALTTNLAADIGLRRGDLIHEVSGKNVFTVEDLRAAITSLKPGDAVALLVEREEQWSYIAFRLP